MAIVLFPDQQEIVDQSIAAIRAGHRRLLAQAPTGSGKGTISAHLLERAANKRNRGLFISPLKELTTDIADRVRGEGVPVQIIQGSDTQLDPDARVTIASAWTMESRQLFPEADFVIVDECHITACNTYGAILPHYQHAIVEGFTATPARGDGRALDYFDYLIQGPQISRLVELGRLAPVVVFGPDRAVDQLAQDPVEIYPLGADGRPIPGIVFASSLEHSRDIAARLNARGIRAAHCEAEASEAVGEAAKRADIIAAFDAGKIDVLVNRGLFTQALDLKRRVRCIILAKKFSHPGPYLQAIGRGRRPGGLTRVYDLFGNRWRHGHPDQDREYSRTGKPIRLLEPLPPVVMCKKCHGWGAPSSRCLNCGATTPPAPLPKVSRKQLIELKNERQDRIPRKGEKWDAFVKLVKEGRDKGRANNYAPFRFSKQFNHPPPWRVEHALEALGLGGVEAPREEVA